MGLTREAIAVRVAETRASSVYGPTFARKPLTQRSWRRILVSSILVLDITIGRTASVSDIVYVARTSSLSKTDISLIYGGVAMMHLVRMRANDRDADLLARPMGAGERGLHVGVDLR